MRRTPQILRSGRVYKRIFQQDRFVIARQLTDRLLGVAQPKRKTRVGGPGSRGTYSSGLAGRLSRRRGRLPRQPRFLIGVWRNSLLPLLPRRRGLGRGGLPGLVSFPLITQVPKVGRCGKKQHTKAQ